MNENTQDHGFTKSHIATVALCAFALAGIAFMKSGFHFSFAMKQQVAEKQFTYEMALAQVQSETGVDVSPTQNQDREQLAMLDSNYSEGSVLGASTGTLDSVIPDAALTLTPEVLAPIKIKLLSYTDKSSLEKYVEDVRTVEIQDGADVILANTNTDDKNILQENAKQVLPLVQDLLLVEVPKDLEEYHKLKMIYYLQLSNLSEGYAGVKNAPDPKETGMQIFSLMERLTKIQSDIETKYGVKI